MKLFQRYFFSCFIIGFLLLLCSCSAASPYGSNQAAATESHSSDIQIGITFDSFVLERWQRDRDIFVSSAKDLGAEVFVQNANGDSQEQIRQIDYFIKKKMDVIVVIAVDGSTLTDEVKKARNAGIKVIAYDRLVPNADADLYISFDNVTVGNLMADTIIKSLPQGGDILKINGPQKDNNVKLVNNGFDSKITNYPIRTLGNYYASEWNGEEAFQYLSGHQDLANNVQAIMCGNDSLAGQAITYLSEQRLAGKVIVVGQDADLDACQRIVEGTQTMTVFKPIDRLAKKAAECAVALVKGDSIGNTSTISDGMYQIPYLYIEPVAVTKDNINSVIIDSGFHLKEDVYLQ